MRRAKMHILAPVMNMKNSKELLSSLLKTTQMGQVGIRSVLDTTMKPELRKALESQLHEYDAIESEAHRMAFRRGWELPELDPGIRFLTDRMTRIRLGGRNSDSRIAGMMIEGNTKGMIKGIRNMNRFSGQDEPLRTLSQKLLDCENANIKQMQNYL